MEYDMDHPIAPPQRGDIMGISELEYAKQEFGIDVPAEFVPLPSQGTFYPEGHPWHKRDGVQIKAMTAAEEDILLNESYAKQNITLDKLIDSCLIGNDKLSLEGDNGMAAVLLGDRNALMLFVRLVGYGPEYQTSVKCPSCGKTSETVFDLGAREIHECKHEPVQAGQNLFEFTLPKMKKSIRFRLPVVGDEKHAAELNKRAKLLKKKHGEAMSALGTEHHIVTNSLKMQVLAFENKPGEWVTDPGKISKFVSLIPALDSRALRAHMKECEPAVDMGEWYECNQCQWEGRIEMPIGREFFWPDA